MLSKCKHEIDPETIVFDPRYGRRAKCALCGTELRIFRKRDPKNKSGKGKVHMSKKKRLRLRREGKKAVR